MKRILALVLIFYWIIAVTEAQVGNNLSGIRISKAGGRTSLSVDGKPFLILGGELGNSSASNANYLRPYWSLLKEMNLNTLLVPVYWELIQPEENRFDFSLVDTMILTARKYDIKLVFLWFGTWKNSMSCYAPLWMKTNPAVYTRTADTAGRSQELFSVFGKATLEADKKAFAALMKHIRLTDQREKTVLMVQVENEIGMLPLAREYSKKADSLYKAPIPAALKYLLELNQQNLIPEFYQKWEKQQFNTKGNWPSVFGDDVYTEEIFQAWHYASFAQEVALAGKKEYDLPMFVNAALPRPGKLPGQYPSAGPLPHLMDIWQAAAPAIDMLSPDFYNPDTRYWCDRYVRNNNTLFIPEIQFDASTAAKAFFVIGRYHAIGFSPFSIENNKPASVSLTRAYDILKQLSPVITANKWLHMDGFFLTKKEKEDASMMGDFKLRVVHYNTMSWASEAKDSVWSPSGGIVIQTAPDEFLIAGTGIVVEFENIDRNKVTNILEATEVSYQHGVRVSGRRMNGDEDHQGRHIRFPVGEWGIQHVKLYNSPARIE
ncbi:MAG: DUF5597 domain-containing protein [Bacteroidetes bacterium]|nr:DUF5597 domain-containing protein [Bacteroidota bacterium]